MARRAGRACEECRGRGRPLAAATLAVALATGGCAGGASTHAPASPEASSARAPAPPNAKTADPLQRANGDFHVEYAAARAREQATLGASRPYLFIGGEKIVLKYHGATEERSLSSTRFDAVKDASHVAIAALSAVLATRDAKALAELAQRIREVEPAITAERLGDAERAARGVVRASVDLLERASVKALSEAELHDFGLKTREDTLTLLQAGCDEALAKLDAATRQLRPLVGEAWPQAVAVIATDHQSRAQEVGAQYFEALFHEHSSEGALGESRIVILESIGPNDGAMQSMASHLYDQRLSVLLFDDPTFLQGDVLGRRAAATIARLLATPY